MFQKMKRAQMLKRLFEAQKHKVPTEWDEPKRDSEAGTLMDKLVGPQWRVEIEMPDVTVMNVPPADCQMEPSPHYQMNEETESFYRRVMDVMADEGMDEPDVDRNYGKSHDPKDTKRRAKLGLKEMFMRAIGGKGRKED